MGEAMNVLMDKDSDHKGMSGKALELSIETLHRAPRCVPLEGEAIRDVALLRSSNSKQSVFVLHAHGERLAECFLEEAIEAENAVWGVSTNWLRSDEHVCTVAVDNDCDEEVGSIGGDKNTCVVVGTDKGRMVKTRKNMEVDNLLIAAAILYEDTDMAVDVTQSATASTIQILPSGHLLILRDGCRDKCKTIQAVDKDAIAILGEWQLPTCKDRIWSALTGDKGYVYLVSLNMEGHEAQLWRFPLPSVLQG